MLGKKEGEALKLDTSEMTHMDVSPKQLVSIVTGLIPFLEHDDANRALMGSNMQRQAVPLLITDAPIVGTGIEKRVAKDSGAVIVAEEDGLVEYVDGLSIVIAPKLNPTKKKIYSLKKFLRSNSGSCINQTPLCRVGDSIKAGDVIADGPATDKGEIALGKNVLVAFMPWLGYNYEDAIIISESLLVKDAYTSIHLEEFELTARDTKLGQEEITRDIPNVSDEALADLGGDGIIRIGAKVVPGKILVGKIRPKVESEELAPEQRLILAIFGEKGADVQDASLVAPPGTEGTVIDVRVFCRTDKLSKTDDERVEEATRLKNIHKEFKEKEMEIGIEFHEKLGALLLEEVAPAHIMHRKTGDILLREGQMVTQDILEMLESENLNDLIFQDNPTYTNMKQIFIDHMQAIQKLEVDHASVVEYMKKGDAELEAGVIRQVKVYVASKRKLEVGDKMAGRHGNKGVVSNIVPESDMPFLSDGRTIEIILNPLGVPSRMNIGQLLETHLGFAARQEGIYVKVPVFEGFPEEEIWNMMRQQGIPDNGKLYLYDGRTGERFDNPVVVGYIYMLKLSHLVIDKIHARSIGPYSLVTQQPLGGKAQRGGQRFGEMEVWALEAYGASYNLQETLTVKSDDVSGRQRIYESIVKGDNVLRAGIPESFNVLIKEVQGLCLDVQVEYSDE